MQSPNKEKIAYLSAVALLLSYAEAALPRFVPFLKLGLSNAAVLSSLDLPFLPVLALILSKTVASCLTGGTLFSPFFAISLCQSVSSGIIMFALNKIKRNWISVYGISVVGSVASGFVQISLCALYLGRETLAFSGIIALFSVASGIATAWISTLIHAHDAPPHEKAVSESAPALRWAQAAKLIFILILLALIFVNKNVRVALVLMALSLALQKIARRKIFFFYYIGLWIFVLVSCVLSPMGKVLFEFKGFSVTDGALLHGALKAMQLTAAFSISQYATTVRLFKSDMVSLTFFYFDGLCASFKEAEGSLVEKLRATL